MVAGQLRRVFRPKTSYFDNLVTPFDGLIEALNRGCHKILRPEDFEIASWEGFPSAREIKTGIFFTTSSRGATKRPQPTKNWFAKILTALTKNFLT